MAKKTAGQEREHRVSADGNRSDGTRAEEALRAIVDGIASQVGEQFFRALVRHLAAALKVRFAFVAEQMDHEGARVGLVAFWEGDGYGENFEYSTRGTPCEHVVGKGLASFPCGLRELFPEDAWLREVGAESYLAIPLFDSTGRPLGHLGVMHDEPIDDEHLNEQILRIFAERAGGEMERKRTEEALRLSEERYRVLYEDNPTMYFTVDTQGTVLSVNRFGAAQLGYTVDELVGQPVLDVFHEDDKDDVLKQLAACVQDPGRVGNWEFRKVRKDGSMMWVKEAARAVPAPDGDTIVLIVCEDITERKQTEDALREAREELESRVESRLQSGGVYELTFRELTVLHLVVAGRSDKEIGAVLGISPRTVSKHVENILSKMNASSRTEAGVRAVREGLLG